MQAMEQTDYNITKSAKLLGLTFRTLQYRLEKFGIKSPDGRGREERGRRVKNRSRESDTKGRNRSSSDFLTSDS